MAIGLRSNSTYLALSSATSFDMRTDQMLRVLFKTTTSAPTSGMNRLCAKNTTGTGTRAWGIRLHNGTSARLTLNWYTSGSDIGVAIPLVYANRSTVSIATSTEYDLLIICVPGPPFTLRMFLNGVEVFADDGANAVALTTYITDIPDATTDVFSFGKDAKSGTNNATFDLGEVEMATAGFTATTDFAALASSLYNSAVYRRIKDVGGYTVANYFDLFTIDTTGPYPDKVGSESLTASGTVTAPTTTHITHFTMLEPIAQFSSPATTCYDATSGGSLVSNNGNVSRWEDQSGRKLHLTVASAGHEPVLRSGAYDFNASVFFDKFDSSWNPQATGLTISGVRLNPGAFSVAGVYSARGWRGDLNGTSANNPGAFNTIWSVDGNTSPSTRLVLGIDASGSEYSSGILRTPNAANSGTVPVKGSDGTPGGQLFAPTSPSFLVHSSDGTSIFVGLNDLSSANSATLTQAYAAANTSGGIVVGRNPNNVNFNFDGGIYVLNFYNRAITQAERESLRDTWDAAGYFTKSPTELWFGMGSSSMWGQEAAYGRELFHFLWHTKPQARRAWIYNYGSPRARLDVDSTYTTTTANTVPKHDTHAVDTIDIVQGLFSTLSVRLITWAGINDLAGAAGAPTAAQTAADTLTKLNTYLTNRITSIGSSRIRQSVVFTVWVNTDMAGAELTERTTCNDGLFTDAGYGTNWRKVIDLRSTVLDDMTTAGSTYTSDSKHPNETAFTTIIGPMAATKLLHEPGARLCRARCLCRNTSAADYSAN